MRTTTWQKCEALPRRARISGSWTFVSLISRPDSNIEEEERHLPSALGFSSDGNLLAIGFLSGGLMRLIVYGFVIWGLLLDRVYGLLFRGFGFGIQSLGFQSSGFMVMGVWDGRV